MTILDELKPLRYSTPISESLQARIQSKLITLFHQLCHVYEENMSYEFEDIVSSVNTINTMFKYAVIEMNVNEDNIEVVFYLRGQQPMNKIPAGSQVLSIITDENMHYESAKIKSSFLFGASIKRGTINLDRKVSSNFVVTTALSYDISSYEDPLYHFNLRDENLPKIYLGNDNNFYIPFVKMIQYCFHHPEVFYSVFDEYPSHQDMLTDENEFKNFLRTYNNDYKRSKKLLKSKITLLDMQAI